MRLEAALNLRDINTFAEEKPMFNRGYNKMARYLVLLVCLIVLLVELAAASVIRPGIGLTTRRGTAAGGDEIVIFEHTEMGSGGLVLNCPTPVLLKDIGSQTFDAFGNLPLMLGSGIIDEDGGIDDGSNVALGDLSPWFWLHNLDGIPGSFLLEGAAGPLYMGGNIEDATRRLSVDGIKPEGRFKFFRGYKQWGPGELELEVEVGDWIAEPQDPERALAAAP